MIINVLHLTHTDIKSDSRILKEMQSISTYSSKYKVSGIGVTLDEEQHKTKKDNEIDIYSINLISRKWRFLPTMVRHILSLIELSSKMIFKAIKLKPNIIHCNDTMVLPLGVIVKIFTKSKLIYDAHELESNRNGLSKKLGKMTLLCEKLLWKFIDKLIVVSPSISQWYNVNIGIKDTEVIMNSPVLEDDIVENNKYYFRSKFNIPENNKIFLYIGILGEGRGIEYILNTFKNNLDLSSHLIFLGYGELKDNLLKDSENYKNIHVHDAVPHEEVVSIAKSADIGLCLIENVSLSDYYCLPNKLFEYAFAQIPILASNFPDIKQIIDSYNLGKYTELNENDIYKAIKDYENQKELVKIDTSKLYDLSWQAQEQKLIKLYDSLKSK
ncbi:glycosyltransferase [Aliarcobacter trophiarum]|uniref:glycosyltransferase n=1 Tax=Aliarcobacter trophiarum TaxID=708186 RepID=UPI0013E93BA7|nr:glycosyltransferase [Aliarcobacter trophiarum]